MKECPNIQCEKPLVIVNWVGKWWADKARDVIECLECGWRWLEWGDL